MVIQYVLHRVAKIAIAVVAATTLVVAGTSGPAYAATYGWTHSDDMEQWFLSPPQNRFFFSTDSAYGFGQIRPVGASDPVHSGSNAAILGNLFAGGSWVSVGKKVRITPKVSGYPTTCQFSAWVYGAGGSTYNVEVINPTTWNYIAVSRSVRQPAAWAWGKVSTSWFTVPSPDVVLRIAYLLPAYGSAVRVDDFSLTCNYVTP